MKEPPTNQPTYPTDINIIKEIKGESTIREHRKNSYSPRILLAFSGPARIKPVLVLYDNDLYTIAKKQSIDRA